MQQQGETDDDNVDLEEPLDSKEKEIAVVKSNDEEENLENYFKRVKKNLLGELETEL
jgi:hypothetical protein